MWRVAFFSIKCDNGVSITLQDGSQRFVLIYFASLKQGFFFSIGVFVIVTLSLHLLPIPLFPTLAKDYVGIRFQFQPLLRILHHPAALGFWDTHKGETEVKSVFVCA